MTGGSWLTGSSRSKRRARRREGSAFRQVWKAAEATVGLGQREKLQLRQYCKKRGVSSPHRGHSTAKAGLLVSTKAGLVARATRAILEGKGKGTTRPWCGGTCSPPRLAPREMPGVHRCQAGGARTVELDARCSPMAQDRLARGRWAG